MYNTDVANKGMLIPNVEGVSFVNPELQFGTVYDRSRI